MDHNDTVAQMMSCFGRHSQCGAAGLPRMGTDEAIKALNEKDKQLVSAGTASGKSNGTDPASIGEKLSGSWGDSSYFG